MAPGSKLWAISATPTVQPFARRHMVGIYFSRFKCHNLSLTYPMGMGHESLPPRVSSGVGGLAVRIY